VRLIGDGPAIDQRQGHPARPPSAIGSSRPPGPTIDFRTSRGGPAPAGSAALVRHRSTITRCGPLTAPGPGRNSPGHAPGCALMCMEIVIRTSRTVPEPP